MSCCKPKPQSKSNQTPTSKTIHKDMTIDEILGMFPHKAQRLSQEITNAGLHCVGCHAATYETLEVGMLGHGLSHDAMNRLISRLNALLEEKVESFDDSTVHLTPRAASKYLQILDEEGKQGWGMRFSEVMAGCNGYEYVLDYSEKALATDDTYESHGVQIHVNKTQAPKLKGSVIDFVEGLRGSGFKVSNPNVRSSCGCGTSHNY